MSPKKPSRYDELHDKYHHILSAKGGTRYERLAAMVFKALEDRNVVIHDLKLSGADPEVKHQIDVTITVNGTNKRILVECKDLDISGDKVDLDIARSFRSVIEDTDVDEGIILTCNGFTKDAARYAKSKNIKLAILRIVEDRDIKGRIHRIIVNLVVQTPKDPNATLVFESHHQAAYNTQLEAIGVTDGVRADDPVFFTDGTQCIHFNEYLTSKMNEAMGTAAGGTLSINVPAEGWQIQIAGDPPIPFLGIVVDFGIDSETEILNTASQRTAELILSGFADKDIIIYGDEIERRFIDPNTGEVIG